MKNEVDGFDFNAGGFEGAEFDAVCFAVIV